jgi:hypothetical protein
MDELFWGPNWSEPGDEAFFPKVERALSGESWVLAGNYSRTRHIKWRRAELVVYLDLPFYVVFLPDCSPEFDSGLQERNVVGWKDGKHLETFVHPRLNDTLDD